MLTATSTGGLSPASEVVDRPWRRRAAISIGVWLDRLRGRDTNRLLPELEVRDSWNAQQLHAYQQQRLRDLLIHCYEHVPFYRKRFTEAGITRSDILTADNILTRLPPLTKDDVRGAAGELLSVDASQLLTCTTSGSTGRPVTVRQDYQAATWGRAALRRAFRRFGVEPYEPRMMLLSAPMSAATRMKHGLVDLATGRRLYTFYDVNDGQLERITAAIRRYRPSFISAYPSVLHEICQYCLRHGQRLDDCGVRLLHSQSEMLLPFQRESMERVFAGIPILNEYGCVEIGAMAHTCLQGTMHISHDHVILEVVDDQYRPLPWGEFGRVLLTALNATGMPFVRYDIGDEAALTNLPCPCGRMAGAPVIEQLAGRIFDRLYGADGAVYNAGLVHFLIRRSGGGPVLREYLAVQKTKGALHFLLVAASAEVPELIGRLGSESQNLFGTGISVTAEWVDRIPKEQRRKKSYFISELST